MSAACIGILLAASMGAARARPERAGALPNLVPLAPELELGTADSDKGLSAIRLTVAVANRGDAHLDLQGIPQDPTIDEVTALQCIAWLQDRVCEQREDVGRFVWHPDHGHHHFEDFALYELRRLRKGRPDMRAGGLAAEGNKVSFCLIDYESDDEDGSTFLDGTGLGGWPLYSTCVAGSGYQGISRGWRDVYTGNLEGQQIVVDGVPPGTYAVVVTIDPEDRLRETDEADNRVATKVALDGVGLRVVCVYNTNLRSCGPPPE